MQPSNVKLQLFQEATLGEPAQLSSISVLTTFITDLEPIYINELPTEV
jgi:hypothetical protein